MVPCHRPGCSADPAELESPPATPGILRLGRGVTPLLAQVDVRRLVRSAKRSCHRQRTAPPSSVHRTRAALESPRASGRADRPLHLESPQPGNRFHRKIWKCHPLCVSSRCSGNDKL